MATTVMYRISGGEVVKISTKGQTFSDRNTTYWGVLTNPSFPDGTTTVDSNGDLRVLGFAKIWDTTNVRNATAPEISNFATVETSDDDLQDRDGARDFLNTHPRMRKLMIAFADVVKDEINILRQWEMSFKTEVSLATNLNDLKTRVAGLPNLTDRTLANVRTAINNRVSEND